MINYSYQDLTTRCIAHKRLNDLQKRADLAHFPPIDMKLEIEQKNKRAQQGKPETDRDILIGIYFRLGKTAFCNGYPPSINDLIATANKPGGMTLSAAEEMVLIEKTNNLRQKEIRSIKGFWQKTCETLEDKN